MAGPGGREDASFVHTFGEVDGATLTLHGPRRPTHAEIGLLRTLIVAALEDEVGASLTRAGLREHFPDVTPETVLPLVEELSEALQALSLRLAQPARSFARYPLFSHIDVDLEEEGDERAIWVSPLHKDARRLLKRLNRSSL